MSSKMSWPEKHWGSKSIEGSWLRATLFPFLQAKTWNRTYNCWVMWACLFGAILRNVLMAKEQCCTTRAAVYNTLTRVRTNMQNKCCSHSGASASRPWKDSGASSSRPWKDAPMGAEQRKGAQIHCYEAASPTEFPELPPAKNEEQAERCRTRRTLHTYSARKRQQSVLGLCIWVVLWPGSPMLNGSIYWDILCETWRSSYSFWTPAARPRQNQSLSSSRFSPVSWTGCPISMAAMMSPILGRSCPSASATTWAKGGLQHLQDFHGHSAWH